MKFQDGVAPVPTLTGDVSWIAISGPLNASKVLEKLVAEDLVGILSEA